MSYIGDSLARFLSKPTADYKTFSALSKEELQANLQPGDLLLVEGNSRISSAIKYLTQSTWSHVCIFIGERDGLQPILEADLVEGVITVPLDKYDGFNLRICRAVNLSNEDKEKLLSYVIERLGHQYDTKNIFDLMRYMLPTPPIPQRFRRRMLAFGSGDPTKAICSTLVAQAFHSIRYPILPLTIDEYESDELEEQGVTVKRRKHPVNQDELMLARRHFSHFTPRDFDLSPYFEVIKPTVTAGFNYKDIQWSDEEQ
ncbi:YiiX/YebB-like N1pC/P60 family cysteine hydrolase [Glaciecola sp. MF2-115]|uniref:YiiX/YebB-like N1pC/P60 family cysteine hydrolase n=1 Tax=Glaciecola sp. MF2-115 TaxID=3384827 RepID=UPI0039A1A9C4